MSKLFYKYNENIVKDKSYQGVNSGILSQSSLLNKPKLPGWNKKGLNCLSLIKKRNSRNVKEKLIYVLSLLEKN